MSFSLEPSLSFEPAGDDDTAPKVSVSGRRALVVAALGQFDLLDLTRTLTAPSSQIVLLAVPSRQWAKAIAGDLNRQLPNVTARAVVELKRDNNRSLFAEFTDNLVEGMHLIVLTHDPELFLPTPLLAAVHWNFALPSPRVRLLRQAIEGVTGMPVKHLRSRNFEGLDFDALGTALGLYDNLAHSTSAAALRQIEVHLETLLQNLLKRSVAIVEHEQRAVLTLADELLRHRLLNRPDVDRIFLAHRRQESSSKSMQGSGPDGEGLAS